MNYIYDGNKFYNIDDGLFISEEDSNISITICFEDEARLNYSLTIIIGDSCAIEFLVLQTCIHLIIGLVESRNDICDLYYGYILEDYLTDFIEEMRNLDKDSYDMIVDKIKTTYPKFLNMYDECKNVMDTSNKSALQ